MRYKRLGVVAKLVPLFLVVFLVLAEVIRDLNKPYAGPDLYALSAMLERNSSLRPYKDIHVFCKRLPERD